MKASEARDFADNATPEQQVQEVIGEIASASKRGEYSINSDNLGVEQIHSLKKLGYEVELHPRSGFIVSWHNPKV